MNDDYMRRIAESIEEQVKWSRLDGLEKLQSIFKNFTEKQMIVYEYSDGKNGVRELEQMAGVNKATVSLLWKRWYRMGLMERSEKYAGHRMKRSFSITDTGLDVPSPSNQHTSKQIQTRESSDND